MIEKIIILIRLSLLNLKLISKMDVINPTKTKEDPDGNYRNRKLSLLVAC